MTWLFVVAGVVGLAAVVFGWVSLVRHVRRTHRYIEVAFAAVVMIVVLGLLVRYGDVLLK